MTIDKYGTLHLSWIWRDSWDVATNHDVCYAKSTDRGKNWLKSTGEKYKIPINAKTAEYAAKIRQGSGLINQTSMYADFMGNPYISSYWVPEGSRVPQYFLVYIKGNTWKRKQNSDRKTAFSLSGGGTKRIPISRPQIIVDKTDNFYLIYRDIEHGHRVSVAICNNLEDNIWKPKDLTSFAVGQWEPTYDTELWKSENKLHIFIQNTGQGDEENAENIQPQIVSVLEWEVKD